MRHLVDNSGSAKGKEIHETNYKIFLWGTLMDHQDTHISDRDSQ